MFKKLTTAAIMALAMAATIPMLATSVEAAGNDHCKYRRSSRGVARKSSYKRSRTYRQPTYASGYYEDPYTRGQYDQYGNHYTSSRSTYYTQERRPGYYSRHRRLVNTGVGAAAGALVGGLLGGKRGAAIGILAGGAGSQIFTHYQKPRNYARYRR